MIIKKREKNRHIVDFAIPADHWGKIKEKGLRFDHITNWYGHLPPISKTIQTRRARHAGHCWRIKSELISDVLLWTPSHGRVSVGWPARTYIQRLCTDTGCSMEDLPIGTSGGKDSGKSVPAARHSDDDMFKGESVLENRMHKIPWDFQGQTDNLIKAKRAGGV